MTDGFGVESLTAPILRRTPSVRLGSENPQQAQLTMGVFTGRKRLGDWPPWKIDRASDWAAKCGSQKPPLEVSGQASLLLALHKFLDTQNANRVER